MKFEEIKNKIKEIENSYPDNDDFYKILSEKNDWEDFCEEWAKESGFVYDDDQGGWVDPQNNNKFCGDTASSIVCNGNYKYDVVDWIFSKNEELKEEILKEWQKKKIEELLEKPENQEVLAEEISKKWNLKKNQVLANLKTNGRLGIGLRNAVLGWKTEIFELRDPNTNEWLVPKMLETSHFRHTMTKYDQIDKSQMDDFEVDELRKKANRGCI